MKVKLKAAGYVRMSTDKQEDSPARQRREIEIIAKRENLEIIVWYEDHGISAAGSKNRPGFEEMMADAEQGKFHAVIVHELSRFSRERVTKQFGYFERLETFGVRLYDHTGLVRTDGSHAAITAIHADQSNAESRKLAFRSLSGKVSKATQKIPISLVPFGYDRNIYEGNGNFVRLVTYHENYKMAPGWRYSLVPSESCAQWVRFIFNEYLAGKGIHQIATALNAAGVVLRTQHRKQYDEDSRVILDKKGAVKTRPTTGKFSPGAVERILRNPIYTGRYTFGVQSTGKLERYDKEPIIWEDNHPAIIDKELFNETQKQIAERRRTQRKRKADRYLLTRFLWCGHCGKRLHGCYIGRTHDVYSVYRCYHSNQCSDMPIVRARELDRAVVEAVGRVIYSSSQIEEIARIASSIKNPKNEQIEIKVSELQRQIAKANQNLALLDDPDCVLAVQETIIHLKQQIKDLRGREEENAGYGLSMEERRRLKALGNIAEKLITLPNHIVIDLLEEAVHRIVIRDDDIERTNDAERHFSCSIHLNESATGLSEPIKIQFSYNVFDRPGQFVGHWAKKYGRPFTAIEFAESQKFGRQAALYHIKHGVRNGLIRVLFRRRSGWVFVAADLRERFKADGRKYK